MGTPGEGVTTDTFGFGVSLYCLARALSTATAAGVKQSDFQRVPGEREGFPAGLCYEEAPGENRAKRKEVRRLRIRISVVVRLFGWRLTLTVSR